MLRSTVESNIHKLQSGSLITTRESEVLSLLRDAANSHSPRVIARVAGGWVRDKLLGLTPDDIDITLENCSGIAFATYLHNRHGLKIRGNPAQSELLESAKVCVLDDFWVDMCQLRCDEYTPGSRIPTIRVGTPREDSLRRDFTINAIFFNVNTSEIEDFTTGVVDLCNGFLRVIGDPFVSFGDDPLRILRACRFAARFSLTVDPLIFEGVNDNSEAFVKTVSRPSIEKEVARGLTENPRLCLDYYIRCGLFGRIFDPFELWNLEIPAAVSRVRFAAEESRIASTCEKYSVVRGGNLRVFEGWSSGARPGE
jgi:tRNA nucleotidyltransferase (CCA-adding enzyme)